jgi:general secretion pathway protein I
MDISKKLSSQKGITLLEVMVSVAIASIALVSLIALVLTSLGMEEYARKMTEATMIADDRMKDIERKELPEPGQIEEFVNKDDPSGFFVKQNISETIINDVRLVEVEVFWDKKRHSVLLSSYMLKK